MTEKQLAYVAWFVIFCAVALFAWSVGAKTFLVVIGIAAGVLTVLWAACYLAMFYDDVE